MSTPHPLTVASVHLQGGRSATGGRTSFQCGCSHQESTDRWWLCGYHEGFDDGVEAVPLPTAVDRWKIRRTASGILHRGDAAAVAGDLVSWSDGRVTWEPAE